MTPDLDHLRKWIGRTENATDVVTAAPLACLAATLDRDDPEPVAGDPVPPGGHWLYFLPRTRHSDLDVNGHPRTGDFLPPVPLARRMWAGGRITFEKPLRVGDEISRRSEVAAISAKEGQSGPLVLVLVSHEISGAEGPAIIEEPTTTVVVYPGTTARVSDAGNYILSTGRDVKSVPRGGGEAIDSVDLAIMANRIDAILREMQGVVLRTARSAVIGQSRDFSCSIVTAENELLATAEGIPAHIFGSHLQTAAIAREHPDFREGDAYLHNDPYDGNSHAADWSFMVPVFCQDKHCFTVTVKGHQADCGDSIPPTYTPRARDVYEEGALIFPCVRIQRDGKDNDDIIRMCRRRIRVPDQWYGDYLSLLGAARIGERRLQEFVTKYGMARVRQFVVQWFDYSERRALHAIRKLPKGTLINRGTHDPVEPFLPEGVEITVKVEIDPEAGMVTVDLRDNPDCIDAGLNLTEACASANAIQGVFENLEPDLPANAGSFRRLKIRLRENCVVGIPRFPHCCSLATTSMADNMTTARRLVSDHRMSALIIVVSPSGVVFHNDRRSCLLGKIHGAKTVH